MASVLGKCEKEVKVDVEVPTELTHSKPSIRKLVAPLH
jgi:hypothetical protein